MPPKVRTVLFLCTGNYYRSRFAEALFNDLARRLGLGWRASSAGLAIELGVHNVGPMCRHADRRLRGLGVPVEPYLRMPRQVTEADLWGADLIVALKEAEHRPLLERRHPAWVERVKYWHIHDTDCATAEETLTGIERAVHELTARLLRGGRASCA